jgi:transposase InsO family protein
LCVVESYAGRLEPIDSQRGESIVVTWSPRIYIEARYGAPITLLPMSKGFAYLIAIMDWHSRKVLSWQISNVMDTDFCVDALNEALNRYGTPEVFNTDQGGHFCLSIE